MGNTDEIMDKIMLMLGSKDTFSPQELKDFIHLVGKLYPKGEKHDEHGDELCLPNQKEPSIVIWLEEPEIDKIEILLLDGIGNGTGELITLKGNDDELSWHIGNDGSYYSAFLEKTVILEDTNDSPVSAEPLTPQECHKLAQFIASQADPD